MTPDGFFIRDGIVWHKSPTTREETSTYLPLTAYTVAYQVYLTSWDKDDEEQYDHADQLLSKLPLRKLVVEVRESVNVITKEDPDIERMCAQNVLNAALDRLDIIAEEIP